MALTTQHHRRIYARSSVVHRNSITDTIRRTKKRFSRPHLMQNPTAAAEQLDWLLRFKDPALERQFEEAWAEDYCQFSSQWWFGFVLVQLIVVVRVTSKAGPGEWVGNELWSFLTMFLLVSFHFYSTWFRSHLVVGSGPQRSWPWTHPHFYLVAFSNDH